MGFSWRKKTLGRFNCSHSVPKGGFTGKMGTEFLSWPVVVGQRATVLNHKRVDLDQKFGRIFYNAGGEALKQLPR